MDILTTADGWRKRVTKRTLQGGASLFDQTRRRPGRAVLIQCMRCSAAAGEQSSAVCAARVSVIRVSLIWINTRQENAISSRVLLRLGSISQGYSQDRYCADRRLHRPGSGICTANITTNELSNAPLARTVLIQIRTKTAPEVQMGDVVFDASSRLASRADPILRAGDVRSAMS